MHMSISKKGPIGQLELFEIPYFVLVLLIGYMKFLFPKFFITIFGLVRGQTMVQCNVLNMFICQPYQIHCNIKILNDLQCVYEKIYSSLVFKKIIIYLICNSFLG